MIDAAPDRGRAHWRRAGGVALATALVYALVGGAALLLAGPPGYASPLYPSAGIALAACLVFGRAALPGVLLGSLAVNLSLGVLRGHIGLASVWLPLTIGCGAMLQAALGAALLRRHVAQPLVLNAPRDILHFGVFGAALACVVSASVGTTAMLVSGVLGNAQWLANWLTWWTGDTLGVLIGAPLVLTLIGRPAADWQPRRRTLALPLLLALALVAGGTLEFKRLDQQRLQANFERDADQLASDAQARLAAPLHALQALHGSARAHGPLDRTALRQTARWWLAQPIHLQAMGSSERVAFDDIGAFEAAAQARDGAPYHVFDRDGGAARAADQEVVAIRHIEPATGNEGALGVNALSVAAARAAVLATRDSGEPAASAGFRLTQSTGDETGVVLYQALYRGEPADTAARRASFNGLVFVTVRTDRALAGLAAAGRAALRWCLVDDDARALRRRLAGPPGCETQAALPGALQALRPLQLGGRPVQMRIDAADPLARGLQQEAAWLLSLAGLAAAAMLGALLLTITGHSRRTELAVQLGTAELRREVAERVHTVEALRDSEARLRSILNHVPLGVVFLDPAGRVIDCNPRLADMLGRSADALRGIGVSNFVHADDSARFDRLCNDLRAGAPDALIDRLRMHGDGAPERVVRLTASALRDAQARMVRIVAVVEDITDQLRLEASERALQRAEAANRAKSEFVSRMSHELRTPLNAMMGFAQLLGLDRRPPLATQQREWAQQIQRAGWHLLEMINETLDLARIESGAVHLTLAPLALSPLVAACLAMVETPAAHRGVRITRTIDADADAVLADATRLRQVLTNLLSNAVKYNRDRGSVAVSARRVIGGNLGPASAPERADVEHPDCIEIAVADSGLGMSDAQLAELFQPYNRLGRETSGVEGTGIGLVISRRLSELMGGTLTVQSREGRGSTFTLRLPAAALPALPAADPAAAQPPPYQQRLVHYVEDNDVNIEVMRGIFAQRPQIRLETSTLGLDGLARIRLTRPDLVLLDMQLPDVSGLELLRHLQRDDEVASIPVVIVSADATPQHVEQALTSGAEHYITKPIEIAPFLETVDAILQGATARFGGL